MSEDRISTTDGLEIGMPQRRPLHDERAERDDASELDGLSTEQLTRRAANEAMAVFQRIGEIARDSSMARRASEEARDAVSDMKAIAAHMERMSAEAIRYVAEVRADLATMLEMSARRSSDPPRPASDPPGTVAIPRARYKSLTKLEADAERARELAREKEDDSTDIRELKGLVSPLIDQHKMAELHKQERKERLEYLGKVVALVAGTITVLGAFGTAAWVLLKMLARALGVG